MLQRLQPLSSETDHLFVGTDRYMYFTVSWDQGIRDLRTERSYVNLADNGARDTQRGDKCAMDPEGKFIVLELYEGVITVVPILPKIKGKRKVNDAGNVGEPIHARIPELFVRSLAFLHGSAKPKLALLWEDGHKKVHLRAKTLHWTGPGISDPGYAELIDTSTILTNLEDRGASHIIPVPDPVRMCGVDHCVARYTN